MTRRLLVVFLLLLLPGLLAARSKSKRSQEANRNAGEFDYYLLSLSWAPGFCAQANGKHTEAECGTGKRVGFIVHGLWPQRTDGVRVEQCGPARPVSADIVNSMLALMTDAGLVQHEWATHGTCSGLSQAEYFGLIRKAFESVQIPGALKTPGGEANVPPGDIEGQFSQANKSAKEGFRISCPANELREVRICLDKSGKMIACPTDLAECHARTVRVLPVR
jgi:ribonuclease T2